MTIKVGINGFGRMGRLFLRAAWRDIEFDIIKINDPFGETNMFAHLLEFDSTHGHWQQDIKASDDGLIINGQQIDFSHVASIEKTDWSQCDLVIEGSGKMRNKQQLMQYIKQGVKKVLVTAPVDDSDIINIVMGVNHENYDIKQHDLITAASCTTNCLAPVVKVLHESIGIKHGSMTSIHDITNTQSILDSSHHDLRRARACGQSLIPTTTGSAAAIALIFPELKGKINGHAVRVPVVNASLVDCVFELTKTVSETQINALFEHAANHELKGILGFETRPLVSIDYKTDPRSAIIDARSTMVINGTQLKMYIWYDNEWGYVNRCRELATYIMNQSML